MDIAVRLGGIDHSGSDRPLSGRDALERDPVELIDFRSPDIPAYECHLPFYRLNRSFESSSRILSILLLLNGAQECIEFPDPSD